MLPSVISPGVAAPSRHIGLKLRSQLVQEFCISARLPNLSGDIRGNFNSTVFAFTSSYELSKTKYDAGRRPRQFRGLNGYHATGRPVKLTIITTTNANIARVTSP